MSFRRPRRHARRARSDAERRASRAAAQRSVKIWRADAAQLDLTMAQSGAIFSPRQPLTAHALIQRYACR